MAWINRISWLLFVVLIFGIIGCSQTQAPSSQPQTPVVPAPTPAIFEVTQLLVSPLQVQVNEAVKITITITNSGSSVGIYPLVLKINDVEWAEKNITISAGSTETTHYLLTVNQAGKYMVTVGGLNASFTVGAPPKRKFSMEKR